MQAKFNAYKQDGKLAMKHMWFVILAFSIIQVAVSITVAVKNANSVGGFKSAIFAAIWAMLLVIMFAWQGALVVFYGRASALLVGFVIGASTMMCQLFFVLMCIFFILGEEAGALQLDTTAADKVYGAFAFFNMIIYFVWSIILFVHRQGVIVETVPGYVEETEETKNPVQQQPSNVSGGSKEVDDDVDPYL